jgi:hypothetical protein
VKSLQDSISRAFHRGAVYPSAGCLSIY